jgi:transcriptional regulator with XRE-family HTH domain
MNIDPSEIRARIKEFAERKGWTAYRWAKEANLDPSTIRKYFDGQVETLTLATALAMAQAAGATLDEMLGAARPPAPALDEEILLAAVIAVEQYARRERRDDPPAPEDKAATIVAMYHWAAEKNPPALPEEQNRDNVIRLMLRPRR